MSDFYDIVHFKDKKGGGKRGVKLGYGRPREGGGFWLTFDSLPYGEGSIAVCPPREKTAAPSGAAELDDKDLPF